MSGSTDRGDAGAPPLTEADVRAQLDRILTSADFAGSERISRFLRFIVEQTLAGQQETLKGYTIGLEVFDRPEDFDPQGDPIVRVEAGRLRDRLARYYNGAGVDDPIRIDIPKGSYVARFEAAQLPHRPDATAEPAHHAAETRRLAAVLSADAVGFSGLMETGEAATLAALKSILDVSFRPHIQTHGGRIVKFLGDGILAEFSSVVAATRCAMDIQTAIAAQNTASDRAIQFRIGIHFGDILADGDDIFGDGVNVAARIQTFAEPGTVAISGSVYRQVQHNLDGPFLRLGLKRLHNIARPVTIYLIPQAGKGLAPATTWRGLRRIAARRPTQVVAAAAIVLLLAGASFLLTIGDPSDRGSVAQSDLMALPKGPSIAVLPFDNLSGDKTQEFFSDGITEEIISDLAQFRGIRILGRNTTFQYKNKPVNISALGQDLGVDYVLEGSVRRAADTVRVTAQLIETKGGTHVWASSFDRNLTPSALIAVQDEISEKVVGALATPYGVISRDKTMRTPERQAPEDLGAYECVLKYYAHARAPTEDSHLDVRTCLQRTIAAEPDYAEAWAATALSRLDEFRLGLVPMGDDTEILDRARRAAEQAVALDSRSVLAHQALFLIQFHSGEFDRFRHTAEAALALNPNHSDMVADYAICLVLIGDDDRGVALARKAIAMSPHPAPWYHATPMIYHMRKGDDTRALLHAKAFAEGQFYWSSVFLVVLHERLGNKDLANAAVRTLLRQKPDFPLVWRAEFRKWHVTEDLERTLVNGLVQAGLRLDRAPG